ncbi:MAG TPA: methanogenesis marker 12 protein [Candidatus Methanoperedenaceae archaeon]|nr:methanogenesis marker 12 protein [Candidatus Methanoperedenaceae archaeon]
MIRLVKDRLCEDIKMIAVTYSMGDAITDIMPIADVSNRGVRSIEGAGEKTGGGARVFDAVKSSGIPAVVIPGIHAGCDIDERFRIFSHGASPEKVGIAYHAHNKGSSDFVVSDISSNTVTLAVGGGRIIGAIDACIFAPGAHHGPIDLEAIRRIDAGQCTANQAFMNAGALKRTRFKSIEELLSNNDRESELALGTIALFAAMEIESMQVLLREHGNEGDVYTAGSIGEVVAGRIGRLIRRDVRSLGTWSAAVGCAEIARDVYGGANHILGIRVA